MRTPAVMAAGLLGFGLAIAGCGDDGEDSGTEPTPDRTSPTPGGTQVAECVVGEWRTVGLDGEVGDGDRDDGVQVRVSGAEDVALTVEAEGSATVDFSGMQPASFEGDADGAQVAGELQYDGQATGIVRTDGDEPTRTDGEWRPADGTTDWGGVRVTLDLTEPVEARPLDDTPIGDALEQTDETTGEVVDVEPMLSEGRYECQGEDRLILSPEDNDERGPTWTLERA